MKEILDKLSSYNVFNYLLPGVVFALTASKLTHYSLLQKDVIVGAFFYYFIGLVISRVGSLFIEPCLKRISFIKFAEYRQFVWASKTDPKLEILSESNNTYRSLSAMILLLLVVKAYDKLSSHVPVLASYTPEVLMVLLLLMFLFAYRKQTDYITRRVAASQDEPEKAKAVKANL